MEDSFIYYLALLIIEFSIISTAIALITCTSIKTRVHFKLKWALVTLLLGSVTIDLMFRFSYLLPFEIVTNLFYNVYTIICLITSYYVFSIILTNKNSSKYLLIGFGGLIFSILFAYLFYQDINMESSTAYVIYSLSVIVLSMLYFRNLLNDMKVPHLFKHPHFWVVCGYLLYYGGTVVLTLFQDYILNSNIKLTLYLWPIQGIANILFTLLIIKASWTMRKT